MAVTDWWLGENGSGWATVVCRSNTNGVVTVGCNGQTFTATADTSVKDGIVKITVTGIGESRVPYTVDGVDGGTLRGKRATGPWLIGTGSCWQAFAPDVTASLLMRDYDLDLYFAMGDLPYANAYMTLYGETTIDATANMATSKNAANYLAHHRQCRQLPGLKLLKRSVPFVYMADDHEYVMDDAAKDLAQYQAAYPGATQADLDTAWAAARAAVTAYSTGNPINVDSGIDSDALYTRGTLGPLEWFLIDCIQYRTGKAAPDDANKHMLGMTQESWLINRMSASASTFKLIMTGKSFWRGGANGDTWAAGAGGYQTALNRLLYGLRSVTGMLAVTGDQHRVSDQWVAADQIGAGYPAMSCLCACPTGVPYNPTSYTGYDSQIRWRDNQRESNCPQTLENVAGLLRVTDTRVERYLLGSINGLRPFGYIDAGSNQVQYASQRVG